jgi:hypothetical protein
MPKAFAKMVDDPRQPKRYTPNAEAREDVQDMQSRISDAADSTKSG